MDIFDEIRADMKNLPEFATTIDDVFMGIEIAAALTPVLRASGIEGDRHAFLQLASIAMRGLELVDAEIRADAEAAQEAEDE